VVTEILGLFATTEVFVYVFLAVVARIQSIRRVIAQKANWYDSLLFIVLFGCFSIFGTYTGIVLPSGAISSIRDLGPLVAGLIAGPVVGLGAGLIGGMHRYLLGGFTCFPCGLATVLAGLIGGLVFMWNKKKLIGVFYAMLLAIFVEFLHGLVTLITVQPFIEAWEAVAHAIPAMAIANTMGIAISVIALEHTLEELQRGE
jgi:phosphoserine phosphatase RsbU/P